MDTELYQTSEFFNFAQSMADLDKLEKQKHDELMKLVEDGKAQLAKLVDEKNKAVSAWKEFESNFGKKKGH